VNGKYELRLYDKTLLSFELFSDISVGYSANINEIREPGALLPLDMPLDGDGVLKWLERRVIPKNRTFVDEILLSFGLSHTCLTITPTWTNMQNRAHLCTAARLLRAYANHL